MAKVPFCLLLLATNMGWSADEPPVQESQGPGRQRVIAPVQSGLLPVPLPSLDRLESSVAQQIQSVQQSCVDRFAEGKVAPDKLAEAYGALGQLYHAYELTGSAEPCYQNAIRSAPRDHRWQHLLGVLYQQTGQLEKSVDNFEAVRKIQPGYVAAAARLGQVYLQLSKYDEAREEFQAALKMEPDLAAAHSGLGEVALAQREYADAVKHISAALERVPGANRLHYLLGMAYRGLGDMDRARQELKLRGTVGVRPVDSLADDLKEMVQGERLHLIQGHLAFNAGRYREAAEAFANAVQAKPDSARGRVNLGTSLAQLGDWQGAVEQYRAALQYDPDQRVAHFNLATLARRTNNPATAIRHYREVLRIDPKDADTHHDLAQLLLKIRRPNEALAHLFRATELRSDDEILLLDLASLLVRQGRYKEARELLDRANQRFPDRGLTASALARLLAACPDASLRDGQRALHLALQVYHARSTVSHGETVAQALAELGRYDEAATWQRRLIAAAENSGKRDVAARLKKGLIRYEAAAARPPPLPNLVPDARKPKPDE